MTPVSTSPEERAYDDAVEIDGSLTSTAGETIRQKYRGAILGAAIGDALGSVHEGTPRLLRER